jgi:hypothetical protein
MRTSSANFGESSAKFGAGFTGGFAQSSELFNKFGEVEVRQVVSKCRTFAKSSVPLRQPRGQRRSWNEIQIRWGEAGVFVFD